MKEQFIYKGFMGSVQFSVEDNLFFGKIEAITDLITFEGETLKDLEKGFQSNG